MIVIFTVAGICLVISIVALFNEGDEVNTNSADIRDITDRKDK